MNLVQDLRDALRVFRRDPRFTLTLTVTLAAGISATAIVFNVLNNTLFRPLPIADEHRVFRVLDYTRGPDGEPVRRSTRVHNYLAIRDRGKSFDDVVAMRAMNFALDDGGTPMQAYVALVSPGSFAILDVHPVLGRLFTPEEEEAGVYAGVIILSYAMWQEQFGGASDVLGAQFRLDGRPHIVVGVLERGFRFPYEVDAWMPERLADGVEASVATIARLRQEVTCEIAQHELDAIAAEVEVERPETNRGLRYTMQPLREQLIGDQSKVSWSLFATAALLLALSCANVANLLLARGSRRVREMAVRAALGASRARQAQQLMVEVLVYCVAGTACGLAIAALFGGAVMDLVPLPLRTQLGLGEVAFDWRVVAFAAAVIGLTAVLAGLAPSERLVNANPANTLRQHARGSSGPRTLMHSLVVAEVAIAAVLLVVSARLADNLVRLTRADLGLLADGLSTMEMTLPLSRYDTPEKRVTLVRSVVEATANMSGVTGAGAVTVNPLDRGSFGAAIETEDRRLAPREAGLIVNNRLVTPDWFHTAGIRLRHGRFFTDRDNERSEMVVIVSRRLAERLWPGREALNQRVRLARPVSPWMTVVGVVNDVRDFGEWRDTWYLPYAQHASAFGANTVHLMVRSPLSPAALRSGLGTVIASFDPQLAVPLPTPMTSMWSAGLEQQRLAAVASSLFGVSGLVLAAIGIYSVLAYAVAARTREFGIRLALGAGRHEVLADVVRRGARLCAVGLVIGLSIGVVVNTSLTSVASESPGTPLVRVTAMMVFLALSSLAASLAPALRVTRVNPADVMRTE